MPHQPKLKERNKKKKKEKEGKKDTEKRTKRTKDNNKKNARDLTKLLSFLKKKNLLLFIYLIFLLLRFRFCFSWLYYPRWLCDSLLQFALFHEFIKKNFFFFCFSFRHLPSQENVASDAFRFPNPVISELPLPCARYANNPFQAFKATQKKPIGRTVAQLTGFPTQYASNGFARKTPSLSCGVQIMLN